MPAAPARAAAFEQSLRKAGVRLTSQRRIILGVLAGHDDHPDAAEIFRRAARIDRTISLSTVYRTMRLLEQHGAIQRHAFEDGRARFERNDSDHHDHLIDITSGRVIEFRSERIEKLQAEIAAELGFDLVRHRLELYGTPRRPSGG